MNLSDKIVMLRKKNGISQEELAEKLNVSRQAVSRWETNAAQPDVINVLLLSRLFGVTTDYLLNDDYESDGDVPAIKVAENKANDRVKKVVCACVALFGLVGNFVIYVMSRFVEVMVPYITYENGKRWYNWSSGLTGHSYKYFIWEYNLEFLVALFWTLAVVGIAIIFLNRERIGLIIKTIKKMGKKGKSDISDEK